MKLSEWVQSVGGIAPAAVLLCSPRSTIQAWFKGKSKPSVDLLTRLVKVSKGQLTYENLLKEFWKIKV